MADRSEREPRAATQLAASLILAFHESEYCVDEGGRETILRVDQHSPDLEGMHRQCGVVSSAFLTAWNPESRECSMTQNEASQSKLVDEISARGFSFLRGEGRNVERTWREESLLVLGIGQVDAIEIGDRFAQNAILFAGADATPRLVLLR